MTFEFCGDIPASKSVLNRALIIQSYFPNLTISGNSQCDDVKFMKSALQNLELARKELFCGEGGTTFRFLALRAAREPGNWLLRAEKRLLQRPMKGLLGLIEQLGVSAQLHESGLGITSSGWKKSALAVIVDSEESSQYASALLLNAWLLDFDLEFQLKGKGLSEGYFHLTLNLVTSLGMQIDKNENVYRVPADQKVERTHVQAEADISSAFAIAAIGALKGPIKILNFDFQSKQPDLAFLEIFKKMKIPWSEDGNTLIVSPAVELSPIEVNISQCPDLFPVLAAVCALANGTSKIYGAPQLIHKESNRINSVSRLFDLLGVKHEKREDGMVIQGQPQMTRIEGGSFNPDKDHRMVMAASLMKILGHNFRIEDPDVINKSFPEFWEITRIQP